MPVTLVSQNFLRETIHNEISLTKRSVIDKAWSRKIKIPADPASDYIDSYLTVST